MKKKINIIAIAIATIILLIAMGCGEKKMAYVTESPVLNQLSVLTLKGPRGATFPLSDTTSFDWDAVCFFLEGVKKEDVNEVVGRELFPSADGRMFEPGPLLVFTNGGTVVHSVVVIPPVYLSGSNMRKYSRQEAVLEAYTKDPGPYGFRFVEK